MTLKLVAIGSLGNMLGPSAQYLQNTDVAQYLRVLDRGTSGERRDKFRKDWQQHGAALVSTFTELIGDGDFDGVVICAGKNGDDKAIFCDLVPLLQAKGRDYFILHLSTVSCEFVTATHAYCAKHQLRYVNYPLTGGAKGAAAGTMLILASGDKALYTHVLPMLEKIGKPKYFGEAITNATEVKLIGHVLVFHGLLGISLAVNLHKNCFATPQLGAEQLSFFDFLNQGAGGTRQWDVSARFGIAEHDWQHGFLLQHAVIDTLYTAHLMQTKQLPEALILPLLQVALLFSYLLNTNPNKELATQAVVQLIAQEPKAAIDNFLDKYLSLDLTTCFNNCIASLPPAIRQTLLLDVNYL